MHVASVGNVSVITVLDVVSRLKVESSPCLEATNPPLEASQLMLRRADLSAGLPRRIIFDHGTFLYDTTSPSPFPTRLHLWLLAVGASTSASRGIRRMPYRILCNGGKRENAKDTPDLAFGHFCYVALPKIRYGILIYLLINSF
jgi:hypothetical protein